MKLLQRWQFASQAEKSLAAEIALCQQYGFDGIMAKALDGTMWMANVDRGGLGSVDDVRRSADACHEAGLTFHVWCNPLASDVDAQADMMAAAMNACDGGAFDTEPYQHFWGAWQQPGLAARLMQRIVGQTDKPRIWQPDPRPEHLAELRPDEWGPHMTHFHPQDYVTDFYFSPSAALMRALLSNGQRFADQYGLQWGTTLPGIASADLLPADAIQQDGGFTVWRIGSTNGDMLAYLGGLTMAGGNPQPQPEPTEPDVDCTAIEQDRDKYALFMRDIADRIGDIIEQEANRKGGPRRAQIMAAVNQMRAERAECDGPRQTSLMGVQPLRAASVSGLIHEGANPH